ncbi:MAG: N-acetyltransferase [Thermodesulfobacteriota bacterium]
MGVLRKAKVADARAIHRVLETYAARGLLLQRPLWDIYSHIREFHVWEEDGILVGVCALHIVWEELAELRSFCVMESHRGRGIGRMLATASIEEGQELGVRRVFVLTYIPNYFRKMGFHEVEKSELPQKVWADCIHCVKFPECDEIPLLKEL